MQKTWVPSLDQVRSPGEGKRIPLQYSCLEDLMDREAQQATVHGVTKSHIQLGERHTHVEHWLGSLFPLLSPFPTKRKSITQPGDVPGSSRVLLPYHLTCTREASCCAEGAEIITLGDPLVGVGSLSGAVWLSLQI